VLTWKLLEPLLYLKGQNGRSSVTLPSNARRFLLPAGLTVTFTQRVGEKTAEWFRRTGTNREAKTLPDFGRGFRSVAQCNAQSRDGCHLISILGLAVETLKALISDLAGAVPKPTLSGTHP
jgi:hypothetical protein